MAERLQAVLRRNIAAALAANDLDRAEEALSRLKELDPLALETRGFELEILLRRGRLAESAALASQLLQLFPGSARVQLLAGKLAYEKKDYRTALGRFEECGKLHPDWKAAHWVGKTLTQLGRLDEAEAMLAPLAREHPGVFHDLAWLEERRGDIEEAIEATERYLKAFPRSESAQTSLRRLRAKLLAPEDLQDEVQGLMELGEEPAGEVIPEYIASLLETGQGSKAREFIESRKEKLPPEGAHPRGVGLLQAERVGPRLRPLPRGLRCEPGELRLHGRLREGRDRGGEAAGAHRILRIAAEDGSGAPRTDAQPEKEAAVGVRELLTRPLVRSILPATPPTTSQSTIGSASPGTIRYWSPVWALLRCLA
jgi:tetratricopeptide (TPR) repeat protein